MRQLQAIVLVIALLTAPMALLLRAAKSAAPPFYCAAILRHRGACIVQAGDCMHSSPAVRQADARLAPFALLAPLTQMLPARLISRPTVERSAANAPALTLCFPGVFLPSPFHPPRG